MFYKILSIIVVCLIITNCTSADKFYIKTNFFAWDTYVDNLDTGSSVTPVSSIITSDGNAEVTLIKVADPSSNANVISAKGYPFAGIYFAFNRSHKAVDLSGINKIILTYKLSGQISFLLSQPDIPPGEEYRIELPVVEQYTEINLSWDDFIQPAWVKNSRPLDQQNISGVKFQITTPEKTITTFGISSFKLQ